MKHIMEKNGLFVKFVVVEDIYFIIGRKSNDD